MEKSIIQFNFEKILMRKTFRGNSDTEVLLHAYDCWGLEMFSFIEGCMLKHLGQTKNK